MSPLIMTTGKAATMSEPWNDIDDIDDIDEMTMALRSAVKSGALSREDAIGHLRSAYGPSQARATDLMREPG